MTSSGRNHGRGPHRYREVWERRDAAVDNGFRVDDSVNRGSAEDHGFRPSQEPKNRSNVEDDVVQDSNSRVPINQLDGASIGAGTADRYNYPRQSQHGRTWPRREANSTLKCTQTVTVVGSSYQQAESADKCLHPRRSQHGQNLPKREANSISKCTRSATGFGSSYQEDGHTMPACLVGKDNTPNIQRTQQDCTSPNIGEDSSSRQPSNSSAKDKDGNVSYGSGCGSSQSSQLNQHQSNSPDLTLDNLLDRLSISEDMPSTAGKTHHKMISSEKAADILRTKHSEQAKGADRYLHPRSSQHGQTLPKREANITLKCTQPVTVVGSSCQQGGHPMPDCSVGKDNTPNIQRTQQDCNFPNIGEDSSSSQPNNSSAKDKVWNVSYGSGSGSSHSSHLNQHQSNSPDSALNNLLDRLSISEDMPSAAGKTHQKMISSEKAADILRTKHSKQAKNADRYLHPRGSQLWQTLPKREANSTLKCTQPVTVVGSSCQQGGHPMPDCSVGKDNTSNIQSTRQDCTSPNIGEDSSSSQPNNSSAKDKEWNVSYDSGSGSSHSSQLNQHQSNSPDLALNNLLDRLSISEDMPSAAGKTHQKMISSEKAADILRTKHSKQAKSADRYLHPRGSQQRQTLPKREANSTLKCTRPVTVVGSSYQQDGHRMPASSVGKDNTSNIQSTRQDCTSPNIGEDSSSRQPNNSSSVKDKEWNVSYGRGLRSSQSSQLNQHQSNPPNLALDNLLDRLPISKDMPSASGDAHHEMISSETATDSLRMVPFDICQNNKTGSRSALKRSLFEQNREKRKELECSKRTENLVLRPGMVLLKKYISHIDQIEIIKKCRELGLGPGGFYQPGYRDGAKLHLHMMCLGKNWDLESRSYGDHRPIDDARPPCIPFEFKLLVEEAIQDSHALIRQESKFCNVEDVLPGMLPDICIVNFYTHSGRLGLHQDQDESEESIRRQLPVVSFSIGDSAEFLYGDNRDTDTAKKVILESGDVLIFGGSSRLVFHGVRCIIPNSAPSFLFEEAGLRPGRINLTFRQS